MEPRWPKWKGEAMTIDSKMIRALSRLGEASSIGFALEELANQSSDIAALTADLRSYSGLDEFAKKYSDYFYNLGIAEQNMVGVACGLSKEGIIPFATTYASFATTRCLDQVRVGMGYMRLPVKLIGLGAGLALGALGATHMACEDIATIRAIPNIAILSPADCLETVKAVNAAANYEGPVYIRLTGGVPTPPVYKSDYSYEIGKPVELVSGNQIVIFATGSMVHESLRAVKRLEEKNISASLVNIHTIRPFDTSYIDNYVSKNPKLIVTVEEHGVVGGLGDLISNHLANTDACHIPRLILGVPQKFLRAGSYQSLLNEVQLTGPQIYSQIISMMEKVDRHDIS